jgi:4-hydroxy-3-polyprenylbenzoate decarboxylase
MLLQRGATVHLTISPSGREVLRQELGLAVDLDRFAPESLTQSATFSPAAPSTEWQRAVGEILTALRAALPSDSPATSGSLQYHHYHDYFAPIASGTFLTGGMVVCPCSGGTLSAVVHGSSGNLIQRAADVHLKERRKLILVPRETPLSAIQLGNMQRACEAGAVVLPAMPGWYHGVQSIRDLVDFIVARILDQLQIEHALMQRWGTR